MRKLMLLVCRDTRGAIAIEYALIAALVAITAITALDHQLETTVTNAASNITAT